MIDRVPDPSSSPTPAPVEGEEALFAAALELPESQRAALLEAACHGNPALLRRVHALLAAALRPDPSLATLEEDARSKREVWEPPAEDAVGQTLGRCKLLEKIGEGGCGVVYVAEQSHPVRRRVALKVIKLGMDSKGVVARFEAERQALAMMDHPHIAKVFDAGTTERGRPYFLMELVRGLPITDFCDREELSTGERLELFGQVCRAIQHAHQKGIIHRDIKPSNILVTLHDGVPVPKVIDFGIAKAIEGRLTEATVYTQMHHFLGSPAYMSPEQAEMSGLDLDTRSDIYSLGVLLCELLTGRTPFGYKELLASGLEGVRKTIREKEAPRPSTLLTQELVAGEAKQGKSTTGLAIPTDDENRAARRRLRLKEQIARIRGDLDWIVMKCLEKDRNRRYETANGLAMDIQRHLRNEPVMAGPPSKAYILKKFIARHKWPAVVSATIVLLILAGFIGTSLGLRRATVARIEADQNAAIASQQAVAAQAAERAARLAETNALREAYSAGMLGASDALERGKIDNVRSYLDSVPTGLRGWEWRHLSSQLDLSVRTFRYPRPSPSRLLVMPDGQSYYEVLGAPLGGIHRRDMETGELLATLPTRRNYLQAQLLLGGRQLLAQLGPGPSVGIELWDLERGTLLSTLPVQGHFSATPDGSRVASFEKGHVRIMNLVSGATHQLNLNASHGVESCFRPDGQRFAFSPALGQVALLDTDSLQIVATFEAHRNTVTALAFSPEGRWLASGSLDGTIRITDVAVRPPVTMATLNGHASFILGLGFSPDGSLLASSDLYRSLRLWDTRSGNLRAVLQTEGTHPIFLPDGRTLIIGHADGVRFWDVRSLESRVLRGHRSYVYPVLISPDGATVYSGGWDGFAGHAGSLRFWDAATGEEIAAWGAAGRWVRAAALSTDGSRLAVSVYGASEKLSRVEVLDTATGTTVATITELGEDHDPPPIDSLAFDPAAETLFWVDHLQGVAYLADARTGVLRKSRRLDVRSGGQGYARAAWSHDGSVISVCQGAEPTIDLLDPQSLELVRRWPHGHGSGVRSVAFSPDSRRILTTSEDGVVRVWETATGARLHDLIGHEGRVLCAIYSPDGKRIASGGDDDNIRIWDAETFHPVARLAGHEDYVYSLAWRADSQQLISGSGDDTVRLWDTQPLNDRMQARRERQTLLAQVEPMVQRLFAELGNAHQVVAHLKADPSQATRARQIALQIALRESLARQQP